MSGVGRQCSSFWAITSYFNPAGYCNRRRNYRLFRKRLGVPLAAVELSFDGKFELESSDAEIVIRKSDGDVMWQKERLLNVALEALPAECEFVLFLDCDVVFRRTDWAQQVCRQLERVPLLQPYSLVHHLPRDISPEQWEMEPVDVVRPSVAWMMAQGVSAKECLGNPLTGFPGIRAPGHAWAVRRELIERHGFYDACIIGGGDTSLACAAYGEFELLTKLHAYNERVFQYYMRWAEPFYQSVDSQVSLVQGDLLHLWHGELSDRRSRQRHRDLGSFQFDPAVDIALSESNCWRWNTRKPEMHQYVANYFVCRNEDGMVFESAAA